MCSLLLFRHGTVLNFSPPFSIKLSFASIDISSNVSTQSDANPGQTTKIFFLPSFGKSSMVSSRRMRWVTANVKAIRRISQEVRRIVQVQLSNLLTSASSMQRLEAQFDV